MPDRGGLREYRASGWFLLRTPALPWDTWESLAGDCVESDQGHETGLSGSPCERNAMAFLRDDFFRTALYIISPELESECRRIDEAGGEGVRRLARTLTRYIGRMATRSTPFGFCAGVSFGRFGTRTRLHIGGRSEYVCRSRVDASVVEWCVERQHRSQQFRQNVLFETNPTASEVAGALLILGRDSEMPPGYQEVVVQRDKALDVIVSAAKGGARLEDLATALAHECAVTIADARCYLTELIGSEIITTTIQPSAVGGTGLWDACAGAQGALSHSELAMLKMWTRRLAEVDEMGPTQCGARVQSLSSEIRSIVTGTSTSSPLHFDLMKPSVGLELSEDAASLALNGVEVLHTLFGPEADALEPLRDEFKRLYGDAFVPLMAALDCDTGVGRVAPGRLHEVAVPVLGGVRLPKAFGSARSSLGRIDNVLSRLVYEATAMGCGEVELDEAELKAMRGRNRLPLPDAFDVIGTSFKVDGRGAGSERDQFLVSGVVGPSGVRTVGRFCYLDARLKEAAREHVMEEASLRPGVIYAEVAYWPRGRAGNVAVRPSLFDYEVVLSGEAGVKADRRISLGDLWVGMRGRRIVLMSQRFGCEVVPRITSAHNPAGRVMRVYSFLAALQSQGVAAALTWGWRGLSATPRLPRVRSGQVLLSLAQWNLGPQEWRTASGGSEGPDANGFRRLSDLLEIPRHVGLVDGDNVLPIDCHNDISVENLLAIARKHGHCTLRELRPPSAELVVTGAEGAYCHEVVIPFVRRAHDSEGAKESDALALTDVATSGQPLQRGHRVMPHLGQDRNHIGSEWLYAKLFCSASAIDSVLRDAVYPLMVELVDSGVVTGWFFVRYNDPSWHLRVRCLGVPEGLVKFALPRLLEVCHPLLASGRLSGVQFDTYDREVVRYGGPETARLCEEIFFADSAATAQLISGACGPMPSSVRWSVGAYSCDRVLDAFGLDLKGKVRFLTSAARRAVGGPGWTRDHVQSLNDKYRTDRKQVTGVLSGVGEWALAPEMVDRIAVRDEIIRRVVKRLDGSGRRECNESQREGIIESLLHMSLNRLCDVRAREQELVIYHYLERHYASHLALLRKRTGGV